MHSTGSSDRGSRHHRWFAPLWVAAALAAAGLGASRLDAWTPSAAAAGCAREMVRDALGRRIDAYLARTVPFGFSGSVWVRDRQGILLHRAYGRADRRRGTPITIDTIFDMGSITKGVTATLIAQLEAEGRLQFSDTLGRFFPDAPEDKRSITLHQLLTHTSGLIDLTEEDDYVVLPRERFLRDIFAAPLLSPPGERWAYSNAGYSVLAAVIEQVSGRPYEAYLRERLLMPAGMTSTGYRLPRDLAARAANTYTPPVDHGTPVERLRRTDGPHWVLLGNGGLLTTSGDMCRLDQALTRGGVIPANMRDTLFAGRFPRREGVSQGYAWTEERLPEGVAIHHGGDAPSLGLNAEYRYYPERDLAIAVLANSRHKGASTRRAIVPAIARMVAGEAAPAPPAVAPSSAASLAPFLGSYSLADGSRLRVRNGGGHLIVSAEGQNGVDALTFQRAAESRANRRVRNRWAQEFAEALRGGDAAALERFLGADDARRLLAAIRDEERSAGSLQGADVLGTARLDRGAFRTTVRLNFARRPRTVRFAWMGNRLGLDSDDAALPSIARILAHSPIAAVIEEPAWRLGFRRFAIYDLATDETVELTFRTGTGGATEALVLHLPGVGPVVARRVG
jgi:CubicO group peptidase (beta-lactamase class C family)